MMSIKILDPNRDLKSSETYVQIWTTRLSRNAAIGMLLLEVMEGQ